MNNGNLQTDVINSLFWKLMERGGTQGIQFVVQIVLARLLMPEDYGLIALVLIFITIATVFVQSGFNSALVQKKDVNEVDFSSVFYLSLSVAGLLYLVIFFTAPFIAAFYAESDLVPVFRVLSLTLFLGVINSLQYAVIQREMQFRKLFFSSLGAIILSGITGVILAYNGYGVWALVVQQMTNQISIAVILWFTVNWRPRLIFSISRLKVLFSYGWKLLLSGLLHTLYMDLRSLIIGKIYNAEMLGLYNRGKQFPALIVTNVDGSIQSVMFPAFSSQQDNKDRVKNMIRRSIVTSTFVIFPIMVGLAVVAEPLVKILLTDKWLPAVPFLQIYCVFFALNPIQSTNLQVIKALGRSDIFLKLEIIKKIIGLVILGVTLFFNVYIIALGSVLSGLLWTFIDAYPNRVLLNYSYKEQWQDIMPSLLISLIMGLVVFSIQFIGLKIWPTLIIQICFGVIIYISLAKIFKLECMFYLLSAFKKIINSRENGAA